MPKLKAAISQLKREQIAEFESTGSLEVEGCMLEAGDLKVAISNTVYKPRLDARNVKPARNMSLHRRRLSILESFQEFTCHF